MIYLYFRRTVYFSDHQKCSSHSLESKISMRGEENLASQDPPGAASIIYYQSSVLHIRWRMETDYTTKVIYIWASFSSLSGS